MHSSERKDKLEARRLFEAAITVDGEFAIAYAQLAFLHLYEFFWDNAGTALADAAALADGFRLTAFFLNRHVCEPRGLELANARDGFVQAALKALALPRNDQPRKAHA